MKQSIIVCLALLFIPLQNLYSQTPDIIGTSAPNFEVKDMDENLISLEENKGKVVVLNMRPKKNNRILLYFWASDKTIIFRQQT